MFPQLPVRALLTAVLALVGLPVVAAPPVENPMENPMEDPVMLSAGFLAGHPDLHYRIEGQKALEDGRPEEALAFFRRASLYADKASQAMVGEMLWNGHGAPSDRALGYVWMDLAAERGYRGFLRFRERYWEQLDEAGRERAVQEGQAIYARYGDAAAQPRIAAVLRRARSKVTGSRTGFVGSLKIMTTGPGGEPITIDGSKFHDERYWDPKQYAAWHDRIWMDPRVGRVDVGDTEVLPGRLPKDAPAVPDRADTADPPR